MVYLELFLSFLKIGAFSFGGGYAAMPLIQNEVVTTHQWLTLAEFTDLITISQMTPGPIAINSATFVGIKIAGIFGAICATIGCILPSCIIVTILAKLYMKYRQLDSLQCVLKTLRPAIVAMIATSGLSILISAIFKNQIISLHHLNITLLIIFIGSLITLLKTKINPITVMLIAGILNVIYNYMISFI